MLNLVKAINHRCLLSVFGKPHCGEVPPAELLHDHVPVQENLAEIVKNAPLPNMHWVIATNAVVWHPFILARVRVVKAALLKSYDILQVLIEFVLKRGFYRGGRREARNLALIFILLLSLLALFVLFLGSSRIG